MKDTNKDKDDLYEAAFSELLPDEDVTDLIRDFIQARGERGATEEELEALIKWAHAQRLGALLVDMILDGHVVVIDMDDGEPLLASAGKHQAP